MTEPYAVPVPKGYRVGAWEVREPIATGAFGSVYEARRVAADESPSKHENLPKSAALKFLPTGTGTPRQLTHLRELIDREVELHRRLKQPRLIRMYDTLVVDDPARPALDGATVLVLEKAEGSLSALVAAEPRPAAGPALLAQICEGLAQLHHAGWVHGDLKPANVLLMADGSARLADFNMAAELEGTHAYTPAFSTPDYTPPELLWSEIGERGRRIRPSADVWAFGVLAHLLLTDSFPLPGATPTARRDAAAAYARGTDELRLSPELPDTWREIVRDCLTRTHADRIGTPDLLRRVEATAGTGRSPRLPRALLPRRRSRRTTVLATVTAVVAVAALGYGVNNWTDTDKDGGGGGVGVGASGTGTAKVTAAARYGASELRTDKGVPVAYRRLIVDAAHDCVRPEVTPALIAALLKAESNFDPNLSDPSVGEEGEYGIARWTPSLLRWWIRADGVPAPETPKPPLSPADSIPAVGRYLCYMEPLLNRTGLSGDRQVLLAAAYRTSTKVVNNAGGVPPKYRDYATRVAHYLKEYTPPGEK
ncbi:Serine/threonine protein kinase [Streptomyces sp. cf386]|uniref:protein kinase domain-containing protein n=1 Tax=Streptomyces sp. cf386 TaxID=1761904 RepID=UPI0008892B9C|nr:protein kinase [Streptomyces sp. cf386]SDN01320.1 Serine/threonine protein kinase [Streptomyces sp. cf386]